MVEERLSRCVSTADPPLEVLPDADSAERLRHESATPVIHRASGTGVVAIKTSVLVCLPPSLLWQKGLALEGGGLR